MKRIHRLLLSALSGILLSLPWLGFPGWTLFVAFIPLLILDEFFAKYKHGFPGISFWGHAFLATLIWNIASSWWMAKATILGVGSAMLFNSFLMSLILWSAHSMRRNYSLRLGYIALIAFWISYEYLQFNWDMEWPCLQLGSALVESVKIVQWYEYTGTFGGTLWVLLLNILIFRLAIHIQLKTPIQQSISTLFALIALFIMPLSISWPMYFSYVEKENPRQVAIIQPNVDPYNESYDLEAERLKFNNFLRLAGEVTNNETDFIIGPETVLENADYWNEDEFSTNEFLMQLNSYLQAYNQAEMLLGVSSYKNYTNEEKAPITAKNEDGIVYDLFNTALFVNKEGVTQLYHKSKLVMGVEKTPFLKYFPFLKDRILNIDGFYGTLGIEKEALNFVAKDGMQVAPVICVESVFGEYVTDFVKKGAELIFVITNDGWWKNSRGYKQHLLFSQLRAIETRRSIARAANTGTSCFINQRGDVIQPTVWWEEAAINGTINANNRITFYVKYGDYIARVAIFVSVLLVLSGVVKRFR